MIHKVCRADSTLAQRFRYRCRIHRTFPGTSYLPDPSFQPHLLSPPHTKKHPAQRNPPSTSRRAKQNPPFTVQICYSHVNTPLQEGVFLLHTQKKDPRPSVRPSKRTHSLVVKNKNKQSKKKKKGCSCPREGGMHGCRRGGRGGGILRLSSYIYMHHIR